MGDAAQVRIDQLMENRETCQNDLNKDTKKLDNVLIKWAKWREETPYKKIILQNDNDALEKYLEKEIFWKTIAEKVEMIKKLWNEKAKLAQAEKEMNKKPGVD